MYFGAAWYPEHWAEERWPEDVRLMREAGMNVCRIAEFAWSTLEPTEGHYDFDWLERAIALLHEAGMPVVLGTPTAAPPAWLTHHHPDTLAIDTNGRPAQHGNRCHVSPTSHTFHRYARRIVEQMAKHYGDDTRILGWQIDNEYNRVDYSDHSRRLFQQFLKERYRTLDELNTRWSAAYWSQTYTGWEEIPLPIGPHNPALMLDFRRFVTKVWRDFQKMQVDAIRQNSQTKKPITHNFMGWFDVFDHYELSADLDFVSWDWYVGQGHHDYTRTGAVHDLTRGFKRKNFWVMETQPGTVNWAGINNSLHRGEARCMAWHAVAHGADALLYWQWRSAPGGQEQLHGSLLGADGKPRPFYTEAQEIGQQFAQAADILKETAPQNQVALLFSYDSRWSIAAQKHHKEFDAVSLLQRYYAPLAARNIGADIVAANAPLESYRLVVAPALTMLTDKMVQNLIAFVEQGGTLVLTVRCGQKNEDNALFPLLQPGPLREIAGVEVEEFFALDEPVSVRMAVPQPMAGESHLWAERLRPLTDNVETLARFGPSNGWLDSGIAIAAHPTGANGGSVITVGAVLNDELQGVLTEEIMQRAGINPAPFQAKPGVEVAQRVGMDGRQVILVINHTRHEVTARRTGAFATRGMALQDVLTGDSVEAEITLPAYGTRVLVPRK